jgi:hypothetical protein
MYQHGYFTQNSSGAYQLFQKTNASDDGTPVLVGTSSHIETANNFRWLSPKALCSGCSINGGGGMERKENNDFLHKCIVFHKSDAPSEGRDVVSIDGKSIKVAKDMDLMESILLWCAYSLYTGRSIGGN